METSTRSTSDGIFDLLNLIPGQYRLVVEVTGFKNFQQGPLELRVGDTLSVNVALQVGSQAETVTVTAEAPLLESSSAATGQVVDSKRLESLPLPASNPIVTTMLAVNMTMLTSPTSTYTPDANTQVTNTAAVGTRQGQSVQSIDGMPSMQGRRHHRHRPAARDPAGGQGLHRALRRLARAFHRRHRSTW